MDNLIAQITQSSEKFLQRHAALAGREWCEALPVCGEFSLYPGQSVPDLYGMVDAVYILYTIGNLPKRTDRTSRRTWAERILACQDEQGWFAKLNLRGHSREHATAYAIGALKLLEVEPDEVYVDRIRPLEGLLPLLTSYEVFEHWIRRLGFRITLHDIPGNLGWNYVWRASHLAGGTAAAIGMTQHCFGKWWGNQINADIWFKWFFEWLDQEANPRTGYWQRALWNLVYRKPTSIDLGGAVHFLWIYEAYGRRFPYPEQTMLSTVAVQRGTGLYRSYPMCIDLDGNFCITRSYLWLPAGKQMHYEALATRAIERNFVAVVNTLTSRPLTEVYRDSHGLPGALAALVECAKFPGFRFADAVNDWQHPLDRVWWL